MTHPGIEPRIDAERGCGWRKPGGLYLVSGSLSAPCGLLPIPLDVCPTCGDGVHPSRGWTWIDGDAIVAASNRECDSEPRPCIGCPLSRKMGRVGLLWVGEQYYKSPRDFCREADRLGVSRRIASVPAGFVAGETWVWLAHRGAVSTPCTWCRGEGPRCSHCDGGFVRGPGVFRVFRPEAIEYVTTGTETEEEIRRLIARGITPVTITRLEDTQSDLFQTTESDPS